MNLSLKDRLSGRLQKEAMVSYIAARPELFDELLELSFSEEQPLGWRATWILRQICSPKDPKIHKKIPDVLNMLPNAHESHQREWLKTLFDQLVDEEAAGTLFDLCITLWNSIHKHPALRVTALEWLVRLVERYPELKHEVQLLVKEEYLDTLTPGIRKSCDRLLARL